MIDESLIRIYLDGMPHGNYHRKDGESGILYMDGSKIFSIVPCDNASDNLIGAIVYLLNKRGEPIGKK